jgi:hypothetical protein
MLSWVTCLSQEYSYKLVDGWTADRVLEVSQDTFVSVGLKSPLGVGLHQIQFNVLSKELNVIRTDSFTYPGAAITTFNNSFSVNKIGDTILIGGSVNTVADSFYGLYSQFNTNLDPISTLLYQRGKTNSVTALEKGMNSTIGYSQFISDDRPGSQTEFSLRSNNDNFYSQTFNCGSSFSEYDGCNLNTRQILKGEKGNYYLANMIDPRSVQYAEIEDGRIIKVDSFGNEIWRLDIKNDSTTCYNLLIAPLENGNYIATWFDYYFYPFKSPSGSRWPNINDASTLWLAEFTKSGEIIKTWNLREKLKYQFSEGIPHFSFQNHIISTQNGDIIIVGKSRSSTYGDIGYALRLDGSGQYKWYRQYYISISTPYNNRLEKLSINGVTELTNGGIALAGEYKSDPSDSFPNGIQSGIVLFLDEYGCLEPGCQKTDNITSLISNNYVFELYPNPTNGEIRLINEKSSVEISNFELFDNMGNLVYSESDLERTTKSIDLKPLNLPDALYHIKLLRSDGFFEIHKVLLQKQ